MSDKCSQCGRISNTWDAFGKCPHCNFSPPDAGEKGAGAFFASSGIVYMKQTDEMKGGIVWMCKDISEGDSLAETLNLIYGDGLAAGRRQERERFDERLKLAEAVVEAARARMNLEAEVIKYRGKPQYQDAVRHFTTVVKAEDTTIREYDAALPHHRHAEGATE